VRAARTGPRGFGFDRRQFEEVTGTLVLVGLDHAGSCTPGLIAALKKQYRLRVIAITDGIVDSSLPSGVRDAVDALCVIRQVTSACQAEHFADEGLRRVLHAERQAFPRRQLRLVCDNASGVTVGRLRRELGLRGPSDETLRRFHSGGKGEALCREMGLKTIRRVELRGGESYDGLVKAVGEGFVMKSAFGGQRVKSCTDHARLLRNTTRDARWVLAQEYLEGDFFHIDSIYDGRRKLFQAAGEYMGSLMPVDGRALGSMPVPRGGELDIALRGVANRVHEVLQPRDLSTHIEVAMSDGQPVLVSVAARLPCGGIQRCLRSNFSVNVSDLDLQVQTGLPVSMPEAEPVPTFWIRVPGNAKGGIACAAEVPIKLHGTCEATEVGGCEGRHVLVSHPSREVLRNDFEHVKAHWSGTADVGSVGEPVAGLNQSCAADCPSG
jgi:hypothetical protein